MVRWLCLRSALRWPRPERAAIQALVRGLVPRSFGIALGGTQQTPNKRLRVRNGYGRTSRCMCDVQSYCLSVSPPATKLQTAVRLMYAAEGLAVLAGQAG